MQREKEEMTNAIRRGKQALAVALGLAWCCPAALALTTGFEAPVGYPVETLPEDFGFGDINNDGITDIVVANSDANSQGGGNSITALLGTADADLVVAGNFATGDRPEGLALAFIDGDSFLDAVTANHEGDSISILLGRGDGTFHPAITISVPGGPRDVVAQDFDGDGLNDFATADFTGGTLTILRGDGAGNATITDTLASGGGTEQISIFNLNGDAHADLVLANRLTDTVTVFAGDGSGGFSLIHSEIAHNETRFVVPRDLNADGLDDFYVSNWSTGDIQIFVNDNGNDFDPAGTLTDPDMRRPLGFEVADINNDENLDVLVASTSNNTLHIFLGEDSPFTSQTSSDLTLDAGNAPIQIAMHDIDGDGFLDLFHTDGLTDSLVLHRSYLGNPGTIVDNGDPGTTSSGSWNTSEGESPFGTDSLSSDIGAQYTWEIPATTGDYEVFLWWTVTADRFRDVAVDIEHANGTTSLEVDQRTGPGIWHSLGVYSFDELAVVSMGAPNAGGPTANADAVRIVAIPGQPNLPPVVQIESIAPAPATEGVSIDFVGVVSDPDGTVASQNWTSSIDGFLSNDLEFSTKLLSAGIHEISLVAIDNNGATTSHPVIELIINPSPVDPPVANAGDDQETNEGTIVTLDGSASEPSDGGPLTYEWAQISGRTVLLQNAELAVATFLAPAVLADEELVFQLTVTEEGLADAHTVTVLVQDVGVGMATFAQHPRPSDITVDDSGRLVLAFHGSLSVANDNEPTDWTAASFRTVGNADPGADIVQAWFYLDANDNGIFDDDDLQLGDAKSFPISTDTITFDGFVETLINNELKSFFVVCEQVPEVMENSVPVLPLTGGNSAGRQLATLALSLVIAASALALLRPVLSAGPGQGAQRWAFVSCLFLVGLALPLSSCGGGGGGGGGSPAGGGEPSGGGDPAQIQLELFDVELTGTNSGQPAAVDGLPSTGWIVQ
jgi:hypothetical protein